MDGSLWNTLGQLLARLRSQMRKQKSATIPLGFDLHAQANYRDLWPVKQVLAHAISLDSFNMKRERFGKFETKHSAIWPVA